MQGGAITSVGSLGVLAPNWFVAGTGDVNADGRADIVWQDSTSGSIVIWFMNNCTISSTVGLGSPGAAWSVIGVGDLDGDGRADLILRNTSTHQIIVWYMDGPGISVKSVAGLATLGPPWQLVGVKDMDGNGHDDLLWFNTATTELVVWFMSPVAGFRAASLGMGGAGWAPVRFGDLDGDGRTDIVWRHLATGITVLWYMNGDSIRQVENYGVIAPGWFVVGAGDYNGDGRDDLIWASPSNSLVQYLMNGYGNAPTVNSLGGAGSFAVVGQ